MKLTYVRLLALVLVVALPGCGTSASGGDDQEAQGDEPEVRQAGLDLEPKPDIEGFSRLETECPFPFSLQHPEGWRRDDPSGGEGQQLTLRGPGDARVGISVYGEMGEEAGASWERRFSSELESAGTIEVGGEEVDVYPRKAGTGYWVIAPFKSEPVTPIPGQEATAGSVTYVAILDVSRAESVPHERVMTILGSLEPNGCDMQM